MTGELMWDWALVVFVAALALAAIGVREVGGGDRRFGGVLLASAALGLVGALVIGNS